MSVLCLAILCFICSLVCPSLRADTHDFEKLGTIDKEAYGEPDATVPGEAMSSSDHDKRSARAAWIIIGVFIFLLFVSGLGPILVAMGIIPVAPEKIHGPRWILAAAGSVFLGAGVYLLQLVLSRTEDKR